MELALVLPILGILLLGLLEFTLLFYARSSVVEASRGRNDPRKATVGR